MARILIVDDEPEIAESLAAFLSARGHSASCALDGAEAEAALRAERPDVVLLDAKLPGVSGFELCRRIKAGPSGAQVKVIMMTGLGSPSNVQEGLRSGASDYVLKPFDPEKLLAKIARVLASP